MNNKDQRITILDGFRAIAILSVMLCHFFSKWGPQETGISLYPYKNEFDYFGWGKLGVQFFFIISGFVIFFTLERTEGFIKFWKNRVIRLLPSMIIASVFIFVVFRLFDNSFIFPQSHQAKNFLPSLTFITPKLFNYFSANGYQYIDDSFWSLWIEVQFYLLASVIYYMNAKHFARNFIVISICLISIHFLMLNILSTNKLGITMPDGLLHAYSKWGIGIFNLPGFLPFFGLGILFYLLFKHHKNNINRLAIVKFSTLLFLVFAMYGSGKLYESIIYLIMCLLFTCFIYVPKSLSFLETKIMVQIGTSSYFLYLIHQNLGIFLIASLAHYFLPVSALFTMLMIIIMILFSIFYTNGIEKKISRRLKTVKR